MCKFCGGHKWVYITSTPIPPFHDFLGTDSDVEACMFCNSDQSTPLPESLESWDVFISWQAYALGGLDGTYTLWQSAEGNIISLRSFWDFWSWMRPLSVQDCPVCFGWGVWSENGQIQDCIACGGQPVEFRQGFEPLYAWWVNWKLGHTSLYTPRGSAALDELAETRRSDPNITTCMVAALETIPGVVRIQ